MEGWRATVEHKAHETRKVVKENKIYFFKKKSKCRKKKEEKKE